MSAGTTPPSRRVAGFTERLRGNPLGEPSGGRTLAWLATRLAAAALVAVAAWILAWAVIWEVSCACTPRPSDPGSPVEGIVVAVTSPSLGQVTSFELRLGGGSSLQFRVGTLENAAEFPPSHLTEHQVSSEPIRVWFRVEDSERVVYRLEDATG